MDHPTFHSLVALSHNMLVMKSIDFHRLPFILLLLKSWMKMYWALWQCYSSLKAKKHFLLLLHCEPMDWGPTQKRHRSIGRWRNLQLWFKIDLKCFQIIACLILIQNIFVFIMAELLFFHLGCRRQSLTEGQPNLWIGTFS